MISRIHRNQWVVHAWPAGQLGMLIVYASYPSLLNVAHENQVQSYVILNFVHAVCVCVCVCVCVRACLLNWILCMYLHFIIACIIWWPFQSISFCQQLGNLSHHQLRIRHSSSTKDLPTGDSICPLVENEVWYSIIIRVASYLISISYNVSLLWKDIISDTLKCQPF